MISQENRVKVKELMEIILYLFIVIVMVIILPIMSGFSLRGFKESFTSGIINISDYLGTYLVYLFMIIGSLFLIIYPIANFLIIRRGEHPATQENPKWYRVFTVSHIFNPEDSALWRLSDSLGYEKTRNFMKWSLNPFRVFAIAIIIFGVFGLMLTMNPELTVVGVPPKAVELQQITPTSDVIFGAGIPSIAENGVLLFILFFLEGIVAYLCAKYIKDKKTALLVFFTIVFLVICPIVSAIWSSWHSIVYGNSDASLMATFVFAYIGTLLTVLTGIFIYWLVFHFANNFFIKLSEIVTIKEDILFIGAIIWILFTIAYISWEFYFYKRKKKKDTLNNYPPA